MKRLNSLIFVLVTITALTFGFPIIKCFAQDISNLPVVPNVPEIVDGQVSKPIMPQVPVIVDGVWVDADTFAKHYSMADLRFVVTEEFIAKGVLYAFSTDEDLRLFKQAVEQVQQEKSNDELIIESNNQSVWLYAGYNYVGTSRR